MLAMITLIAPLGSLYQRSTLRDQMNTIVKFHRQSIIMNRKSSNISGRSTDPLMVI